MLTKQDRILVLGASGMVGHAVVRALRARGIEPLIHGGRRDADLRVPRYVREIIGLLGPHYVFHCAGHVGGIFANAARPADFIQENLEINANVIRFAYESGVKKLLNLGSSCIYPRLAEQPIREDALLSGPLEETNRAYAIAKIAAIELCDAYRRQHGCNFISAMPTNLYGPGDNFDLNGSHVLASLIRKFMENEDGHVTLAGDGTPRREFLYVDDLAEACITLMERYDEPGPINVGTGEDLRICELADLVADIMNWRGEIIWDLALPNGTPRKLLDISRIKARGWAPKVDLREGIRRTVSWVRETKDLRGWPRSTM